MKPGKDAQADLKLVAARRLQGTAVDIRTGIALSRVIVTCSCTALPLSGNIGKPGHTDDQGHFDFFVPPGLACVFLEGSSPFYAKGPDTRTLLISADHDPEPMLLHGSRDPKDPLLEKARVGNFLRPTQIRVKTEAGKEPVPDGDAYVDRSSR